MIFWTPRGKLRSVGGGGGGGGGGFGVTTELTTDGHSSFIPFFLPPIFMCSSPLPNPIILRRDRKQQNMYVCVENLLIFKKKNFCVPLADGIDQKMCVSAGKTGH